MRSDTERTADHVADCLQLAVLLEASAPKPGNVNRVAHFRHTRYEHLLASAVAIRPSFKEAATQGMALRRKAIPASHVDLGKIMKNAVIRINKWQRGGNTLLGTVILLSPMAVGAGMALVDKRGPFESELRADTRSVVESTTPEDAVAVYEAINLAKPNGLIGKTSTLDVNDPESRKRIVRERITLYDVLKISAPYDSISRELAENYPLTFDLAYPYFTRQLKRTGSLDTAIVHTYLKILSSNPDTLIARKTSLRKAREVSAKARKALELGGLETEDGNNAIDALDKSLRRQGNRLNPGTTADIIAAVLAVSILSGYRP